MGPPRPPCQAVLLCLVLPYALLGALAVDTESHDPEKLRASFAQQPQRRGLLGKPSVVVAAVATPLVSKPTGQPYQIGSITVDHYWIDPKNGRDSASGTSRSQARRTLSSVWDAIPQRRNLTRGYHFHITSGTLTQAMLPGYWESRWGTRAAPIIFEAEDGPGTAVISGANIYDCRHIYFIGVNFVLGGDHPIHCERCINVLLRKVTIAGVCPRGYADCGVQEAAKLNQCQGVWVEDSNIYNAWNVAFDCVACQYGHLLNSSFHHSAWCAYMKGGSAYWLVAGNEAFQCAQSGLSAGQGAGFEYMVSPWIQYEAYDVKMINNYIHDIDGAGLGVWGCYNCLLAHNTLVRVGSRSHTIEVNFGTRLCTGDNVSLCRSYANAGGWGPPAPVSDEQHVNIPNQNIIIVNNLIYNPPGYQSQWQHLQFEAPVPSRSSRLPATVRSDNNLVIRGNLFWNGPAGHPTGSGDSVCNNPTCSEAQLQRDNYFNTLRPQLQAGSSFRPAAGSGLGGLALLWRPLPPFAAWQGGLSTPAGTLTNAVPADRAGASRAQKQVDAPGAYVAPPGPARSSSPPPPSPRRRPPLPPPPVTGSTHRPPPPRAVSPSPSPSPSPGPSSGMALPTGRPFDIGPLQNMQVVWINPRGGNDNNDGSSQAKALSTLAEAVRRIPRSTQLQAGIHIRIMPGNLSTSAMPNYWESLWGSRAAPIIVEAVGGLGSVTTESINAFDCRHLYIINLVIRSGGEPFHCEKCTHTLLRNIRALGICPRGYSSCSVQETIKMNQCKGVWVENIEAAYANDNAFDCVACQYGHILNSVFYSSEWGVYLKGGSAYFIVAGNEIHSSGTTGFAAGQGTGFEFMESPWLQYEAYDIKVYNNIIHDIDGAGMGVWGCYNCLFAYNTLVRVGKRSHVLEIKFGERGCDGNRAVCAANHAAGGWGPSAPGGLVRIPNLNVMIANNVVFNPSGFKSQWQHLQVDSPDASGSSRLPGTVYSDRNLVFRGNVVWNGDSTMPLGVGGGCPDTNPTCNPAQLLAQNAFNTRLPDLNLTSYRPLGACGSLTCYDQLWHPLPDFGAWQAWSSPGPAVPTGTLGNSVACAADRAGAARTAQQNGVGAYALPGGSKRI